MFTPSRLALERLPLVLLVIQVACSTCGLTPALSTVEILTGFAQFTDNNPQLTELSK